MAAVSDVGCMCVPAAVCTMRIQSTYVCLYVCYIRMV